MQEEFAIAKKTLERWARERLEVVSGDDGSCTYLFRLSGSTCNNMGLPIMAMMLITTDPEGRIVDSGVAACPGDTGLAQMCAAVSEGDKFMAKAGVAESHGMTIAQAAFHAWDVAPSGCFCSKGNRLHKWRNAFQTIYYHTTYNIPQRA